MGHSGASVGRGIKWLFHVMWLCILAMLGLTACTGAPSSAKSADKTLPVQVNPEVALALEGEEGSKYFCSATAIGDAQVLTAAHCVPDGSKPVTVWTHQDYLAGRGGRTVEWVYVDRKADIAVGRLSEGSGQFGDFAQVRCTLPNRNDFIQHVHNGKRDYWRYDAGFVVGFLSEVELAEGTLEGELLLVSMRVLPGSSGAGVFDRDGRLVGVVSAGTEDATVGILTSPRNILALCGPSL